MFLGSDLYNSVANRYRQADDDSAFPFLTDVEIESTASESEVSLPFNVERSQAKLGKYDEIQFCLEILSRAKERHYSRHIMKQKSSEIKLLWSCRSPQIVLCGLVVPGVLLSGILIHHIYLSTVRKIEIEALQNLFAPDIQAYDVFMRNYTASLQVLNDQPYADKSIASAFKSRFSSAEYWFERICAVREWQSWYPENVPLVRKWQKLFQIMKELSCGAGWKDCHDPVTCTIATRDHAYMESIADQNQIAQMAIEAFIHQNSAEKTLLEGPIHELKGDIDSLETTWSPVLMLLLLAALLFNVAYILHLYLARRRARIAFESDFHPLEECLVPKDVNRIVNLAAQLEISIAQPLEVLALQLDVKRVKELKVAVLFEAFSLLKCSEMPQELIAFILEMLAACQAQSEAAL